MRDGFIKVAAVTPDIRVADCEYNAEQICKKMKEAAALGSKIIVFPELCITGYTCEDLFWQEVLLNGAKDALDQIRKESREIDALVFVGLPWEWKGKLYNVAAAICHGRLLGLVPKKNLPNYSEFYEMRHFEPANEELDYIEYPGEEEQEWVPQPPSITHAIAGANVIVNLSASDEITGKDSYRRNLVGGQSARLVCGYIYADAGEGESSTDLVFAAHNLIAENGTILAQSKRFENEIVTADLDIHRIRAERRRMTTYPTTQEEYEWTEFELKTEETKLERTFAQMPFVPQNKNDRERRCEEILSIQALGLKKRLVHTNCKSLVVGISGGLDSTLALLVAARACDMAGIGRDHILSVTMPCFGTTDRTYQNAVSLIKELGATLKEVRIEKAVRQHFADIGHDENNHDVTYENSQARERTQILMDMANQYNGMVIGTGDMSELALGWATYNGDHMSMYAVNVSVPKTLVKYLVRAYAELHPDVHDTLESICDTIISPELLPPDAQGNIAQSTEATIGKYDLHDFFLYHFVRNGFTKEKIQKLAEIAFAQKNVTKEEITSTLDNFFRRFYAQQFKRSCLPDGPKVGTVSLSPRGDWRMPSDAKNPY